jgi:hypothetical protein
MSIIDILLKVSPALEQGKSLANAEGWKNVANANHSIVIVLGFILVLGKQFGYDFPISDAQVAELAGAVAGIGQVISLYFHHSLHEQNGIKR